GKNMESQFLSAKEAATYLGLSTSTIFSWRYSGKLPGYKLGRLVKFKREDLDACAIPAENAQTTNTKAVA
ncbi:MAG: helix-turn-helix domain-containing protein, partial [Varibaculum cambriense]|nr:helix-turn-helix domain-containing protein [Varibaculum cambriense]